MFDFDLRGDQDVVELLQWLPGRIGRLMRGVGVDEPRVAHEFRELGVFAAEGVEVSGQHDRASLRQQFAQIVQLPHPDPARQPEVDQKDRDSVALAFENQFLGSAWKIVFLLLRIASGQQGVGLAFEVRHPAQK